MKREAEKVQQELAAVLDLDAESRCLDFFVSSLTEFNPGNQTEEIVDWLVQYEQTVSFQVEQIPLAELRKWYTDPHSGDLCHASGGFFSIRGLEVYANAGPVKKWTQPIIDQPKIGLLGFLTQKIDGILYFLVQAKAEPGNINTVQLAPTVQATRSNYVKLHGGKPTRYLEYFLESGRSEILFDQLQTEQGARFFRKRNRNMIVRVPDDETIDPAPDFRWMTLGQLKGLMLRNNTVNMDARSVLSNISYCPAHLTGRKSIDADRLRSVLASSQLLDRQIDDWHLQALLSGFSDETPVCGMDELMRRVCEEKFQCELETRLIPLSDVQSWLRTPLRIFHEKNLYFSVIGVRVTAENREVPSWDQPIIKQQHPGIVGFITRKIEGVLHFLVQLKMESGNIDLLGMAPTVQCITGSYEMGSLPPYVAEMLVPTCSAVIFDTLQSEEGGRFFREENRNVLLHADERLPLELPQRYLWMTLKQLKQLLLYSNFLNVEARSLLAFI